MKHGSSTALPDASPAVHPVDQLLRVRRFRLVESLPWLIAIAAYFVMPHDLQLGTQILSMAVFALSFDLLLGYAGVVTLGHAAYYGAGAYTAGLLAHFGWSEPLSGLVAAMLVAGALGALSGAMILRTRGLALLMLGMAVALLLREAANDMSWLTGGADGLQGVEIAPIFGRFDFDMYGRTGYVYCLCVLFVVWLFMRELVNAPFGRSLVGIRQNPARMEAIGVSVWGRRLLAFTISAAVAGLAGALSTQTNQFVSLNSLGFDLSGTVLVMVVIGGPGRLYGAFLGVAAYMIAQDSLSRDQPVFWVFWIGLLLIGLVLFGRGGLLGIVDRLRARIGGGPV